jgi:uncharacterized membrane protein
VDEIAGKPEAQRTADDLRTFRRELARLETAGVLALTEDQRRAVDDHIAATLARFAARFDIDTTESQKQISVGMRIASAIGGLALCAAVYFFFYRYWGLLSTAAQVAVLALAPVLFVLAAEFVSRRERTLYFTSLLVIVAFAAFVMDLSLLGVIFNLEPTPGAPLAWGLFGLALAYRYRLRLPLAAGLVCLVIWFAGSVTGLTGYYWGSLVEAPEPLIAAGVLVFAASFVPGKASEFAPVYRLVGALAVFIPMLALALKIYSYLPLAPADTAMLYQVAGMLLAAAAIRFGIPRRYDAVVNIAAGSFALFLYCRFVAWWWDWMPRYLFFLVVGLLSLGLLAVFGRMRSHLREAA